MSSQLISQQKKSFSTPSLKTSKTKFGNTFVDFFATPKQNFQKIRLSVNLFELKVKKSVEQNSYHHTHQQKKTNLQILSKNSSAVDYSKEWNCFKRLDSLEPNLDGKSLPAISRFPDSPFQHQVIVQSLQKSQLVDNFKKNHIFSHQKQKNIESEKKKLAIKGIVKEKEGQHEVKKNYFIKNLEFEENLWKNLIQQQTKDKQIEGKKCFSKTERKQRIEKKLDIPDPLKTFRLCLNPEENQSKMRKKFKINLVKKKEEEKKENSKLARWDTLEEDQNGFPQF